MKYVIDYDTMVLHGPFTDVAGDVYMEDKEKKLSEFLSDLGDLAPYQSGILPVSGSGLLAVNRGFGYEQIIYQLEPGIVNIKWGSCEGDPNSKIYQLAVPYRILLIDYLNKQFQGIRHFYSVNPITSYDQELYLVNLPNTNTTGYRGTGLGWVCIYHKKHTAPRLEDRIQYALRRYNPIAEPYNDDNMSETDGTRFYADCGMPLYTHESTAWQKKTRNEGYQWMLNPDNLIVAKFDPDMPLGHVESHDSSTSNSRVYTLHDAAFLPYSSYYTDACYKKPWMYTEGEALPKEFIEAIEYGQPLSAPAPKLQKNLTWAVGKVSSLTTVPQELKLFLQNGHTCLVCDKRYPVTETFRPVGSAVRFATDFDGDGMESTSNDNILMDYIDVCSTCFEESCVYVDDVDQHVYADLAFYHEYTDDYHLLITAERCVWCQSQHPSNNKGLWVLNKEHERIGCVSCMNLDDCIIPWGHEEFYLIQDCSFVTASEIRSDGGTIAYVAVTKCLAPGDSRCTCACGLLFDNKVSLEARCKPGSNVCLSCSNSLGEFRPLIVSNSTASQ